MSPLKGSDLVLRVAMDGDAGQGNFEVIEGLRLSEILFENKWVTDCSGCNSGWQTVVSGAGTRHVEVKASGVFLGTAGELRLRQLAADGFAAAYRMSIESGRTISGCFVVDSLLYRGSCDEEMRYEVALRSSGDIIIA